MMKKTYEKPELNVKAFDVEDVITLSDPNSRKLLQVGDFMENPINMRDLNSAPGND